MPHIDFEKLNAQKSISVSTRLASQFYVFTNESQSSMVIDSAAKLTSSSAEQETNKVRNRAVFKRSQDVA